MCFALIKISILQNVIEIPSYHTNKIRQPDLASRWSWDWSRVKRRGRTGQRLQDWYPAAKSGDSVPLGLALGAHALDSSLAVILLLWLGILILDVIGVTKNANGKPSFIINWYFVVKQSMN